MLFAKNTIHSQLSELNIAHHIFPNKYIIIIICIYYIYKLYIYNELWVKYYVNYKIINIKLSLILHILSV